MMTKDDVRAMYVSKFGECPVLIERMMDAFLVDERGGIYNGATALLTGEIVYQTKEQVIKSINAGLEGEIRQIRRLQSAWDKPDDECCISLESI